MSADLYLYAVPDNPEVVKAWWDYTHVSSVGDIAGDEWFDSEDERLEHERWIEEFYGPGYRSVSWEEHERLTRLVRGYDPDLENYHGQGYPRIWVGQLSILKAGLLEDTQWIPDAVAAVTKVLGKHGGRVMTPGLRAEIMVAMNHPNNSYYGKRQFIYDARRRDSDGDLRYYHVRRIPHSPVGYYNGSRGVQTRRKVSRWCAASMGRRIFWCSE